MKQFASIVINYILAFFNCRFCPQCGDIMVAEEALCKSCTEKAGAKVLRTLETQRLKKALGRAVSKDLYLGGVTMTINDISRPDEKTITAYLADECGPVITPLPLETLLVAIRDLGLTVAGITVQKLEEDRFARKSSRVRLDRYSHSRDTSKERSVARGGQLGFQQIEMAGNEHGQLRADTIYACLEDEGGSVEISATLDYIMAAIAYRDYDVEGVSVEKTDHELLRGSTVTLDFYPGKGKAYRQVAGF